MKIITIFIISIGLAGCVSNRNTGYNNTVGGTVIGGASGAMIGSALGGKNRGQAALIGGLIGAVVGGTIGSQLDANSAAIRQQALVNLNNSTQNGQTMAYWENPSQNTSGSFERVSPVTYNNGRQCYTVVEKVKIQGQIQEVEGEHCQ